MFAVMFDKLHAARVSHMTCLSASDMHAGVQVMGLSSNGNSKFVLVIHSLQLNLHLSKNIMFPTLIYEDPSRNVFKPKILSFFVGLASFLGIN